MLALITFTIGGLLLLGSVIMLLRRAFGTTMLWGVLGLFFVPLYIFAIFRWSETRIRKAVYVSLVGILAILVGISGGALSHLPFLPEHEVVSTIEEKIAPPKETPLPNEAAAQAVELPDEENYDPLLTGGEFEGVGLDDMIPPAAMLASVDEAPDFEQIELTQLDRAVNKKVILDLIGGEKVEGVLTHFQDESLVVESSVAGGSIGYSYPFANIDTLFVLDPAPVPVEQQPEQAGKIEEQQTQALPEIPAE